MYIHIYVNLTETEFYTKHEAVLYSFMYVNASLRPTNDVCKIFTTDTKLDGALTLGTLNKSPSRYIDFL